MRSKTWWIVLLIITLWLLSSTALPVLAQDGSGTHVVQPGETLFRIALRYGTTVGALAAANGITNPALIYVGQTLVIPAGGASIPAPAAPAPAPTAAPQDAAPVPAPAAASGTTHIVQPGDTLFRVALQYGTTVSALVTANGLSNPNLIYVGQVLVISGSGGNPAVAAASAPASIPAAAPAYTSQPIAGAREIFVRGQSLGNRRDVFSKVGDSITASPLFLRPVGVGGLHLNDYGYLQAVADNFSRTIARDHNSFANTSLAAVPGWTSADVLNPANANPALCAPGETPLACEYRVTRPALALILIGSVDAQWGSTNYQANLQQIVQISSDMGVIPVLSTLPDNTGDPNAEARVLQYNDIIRGMAGSYGLPLWDYWAAMQALPYRGISSDGIHPSAPLDGETAVFTADNLKNGYTLRNLTALQVLNEVWQGVLY